VESPPPTLIRRLPELSDKDLEVLIVRRPEVAALGGESSLDWTALAGALAAPANVGRALGQLNRFLRQALELACLEQGRLTPSMAEREGLEPRGLAEAARQLRRWGLAFTVAGGSLEVPDEVSALIHDPGGLGAPLTRLAEHLKVEELRFVARSLGIDLSALPNRKAEVIHVVRAALAEPGTASRLLETGPDAARLAMEELRAAGGSTEMVPGPSIWRRGYGWYDWRSGRSSVAGDAPRWLLACGLVMPADASWWVLRVPAEVERNLRGRVFERWEPEPPPLRPAELADDRHPLELVTAMGTLLREWRLQPPAALQAGGVPKRELKRLARFTGWSEDEAESLCGLAAVAGLVEERELVPEKLSRARRNPRVIQSRQTEITVTAAGAGWETLPEAGRWQALVEAWQRARFGESWLLPHPTPASAWRSLLELLGGLRAGQGAIPAELGRALCWRCPTVFPNAAAAARFAGTAGAALRLLGVGGADPVVGLSAAGRHAFGIERDPVGVEHLFPALCDTCTITADHRIVVAGTPALELGNLLSRIADLISVHPARVFSLSAASLGRALDGGQLAAGILDTLAAHAPGGVPQNVAALVEDVARRHGRLRVGPVGVCVVSDDPALIEELVGGRLARTLRARRLAPTVAVVEAPNAGDVMTALRRAGLMPVADGAPALPAPRAGGVGTIRGPVGRASPAPPLTAPPATRPPAAAVHLLVAALRASPPPGPEADRVIQPQLVMANPGEEADLLSGDADEGDDVAAAQRLILFPPRRSR
jgi:hypothetical protein